MTKEKVSRPPITSYTADEVARPGECSRGSSWMNTSRGTLDPDRGFKRHRLVSAALAKPGASWTHIHTDGTEDPAYYFNTGLYPETGSDSPTAFKTGLTAAWQPSIIRIPDLGFSIFLNGTNSEAQLVREDGSADLEAVDFDFAAPVLGTVTAQTSGGSLADDTYYVIALVIDDTSGYQVVKSGPSNVQEVELSGGGGSGTITIPEPSSVEARATKFRYYVSSTSNTPTAFLQETETSDTSPGNTVITTLAAGTAIESRNGAYGVGVMPLASVDFAILWQASLWICSRS